MSIVRSGLWRRARALAAISGLALLAVVTFTGCSSKPAQTDDFVLTDEERLSLSATAAAFQVESVAEMQDSGKPIEPPQPLPEFQLTDHTGGPYGSTDITGKTALIGFAYTHCPDVCPALFGHLIQVQRSLEERIGHDVEMVLISVDPERDTPAWLDQRTEDMGGKWHFLTGSREQLERVWSDFGVRVEKQGELVGHTGVTYLASPDGHLVVRYPAYATFEHFIKGIEAVSVPS